MRKFELSEKQLWLAVGAVILLLALPTIILPFGRDQASLAYVARLMLRRNPLPYVGYFDHKGPLLPYIFLLGGAGGPSTWEMHLLDLISFVVTTFFLCKIAATTFKSISRPALAVVYAFLYLSVGYWHLTQGESYMNAMVVPALYLILKPSGKRLFFAGVLLGAAACIKPTSLFTLIGALVVIIYYRSGYKGAAAKFSFSIVGGFALFPMLFASIYLLSGYFYNLYECYFLFNFFSGDDGTFGFTIGALASVLMVFPSPLLLSAIGFTTFKSSSVSYKPVMVSVFAVAALLGVILQGKLWLYHWVYFMPYLALSTACGVSVVFGLLTTDRKRLVLAAIGMAIIIFSAGIYIERWWNFNHVKEFITSDSIDDYYKAFKSENKSYDFSRSLEEAEYIKNNTTFDDEILIWGFDGNAYLCADRKHSTRFLFDLPLTFSAAGATAISMRSVWRKEFVKDLRKSRPKLIALAVGDRNALESVDSFSQAQTFSDFMVFLRINYTPAEKVGILKFYKLN